MRFPLRSTIAEENSKELWHASLGDGALKGKGNYCNDARAMYGNASLKKSSKSSQYRKEVLKCSATNQIYEVLALLVRKQIVIPA